MLVENIHTEMNITEYVIQLNSSLGSAEVNKLTKYIKQAMWLKLLKNVHVAVYVCSVLYSVCVCLCVLEISMGL
jgi:spore maturation protein SpmB